MPRFAANLTMLYPELPFLERFAAAARDGFRAVEYLFPYAWEPHIIAEQLQTHGLQQVLFNAPPGGVDAPSIAHAWDVAGDRGTASIPGREAEFAQGVRLALEYAQALNCPRIHVMSGLLPLNVSAQQKAQHHAVYVSNLRWAADEAARCGRDVLIEPINTRDMPGFFLNYQAQAHAVVEEVNRPNLKVQMDLYHLQIMEGDVSQKLRQYLPTGRVGHVQIASVPQRHEPDQGELNYEYLFGLMDELKFEGFVGCEYRPARGAQAGGTSQGLGWLQRWQHAHPTA